MQRLPPDPLPVPTVEVISGQRVADGGKVDPDLVRPPRHRDTGGQAETVLRSYYGILRPAGLAVRRHTPADDALGLTADGGVDDAFTEGQFASTTA